MQVEPLPYDEDDETETDVDTPGDAPLREVAAAPKRRPMIGFFTRRAFLSKDTGLWHQHPGGRDRPDEGLVTKHDPGEQG